MDKELPGKDDNDTNLEKTQEKVAVKKPVKLKAKKKAKKRTPWHVDLKWLFGLLATLLLASSFSVLFIYRIAANQGVEKYLKENIQDSSGLQDPFSETKPSSNFGPPSSGKSDNIPKKDSNTGSKNSGSRSEVPSNSSENVIIEPPSKNNPSQEDFKLKLDGKWYTAEELEKMDEAELEKLLTKAVLSGELKAQDLEKMMAPTDLKASTKSPPSSVPDKKKTIQPVQPGEKDKADGKPDSKKAPKGLENISEGFEQQLMQAMILNSVLPYVSDFLTLAKKSLLVVFFITMLLALILVSLTALFSFRWGRLGSIGIVLFLSALPIFSLSMILKLFGSGSKLKGALNPLALLEVMADANLVLFSALLSVAGIFIVASLVASMIAVLKRRPKKSAKETNKPTQTESGK